jgi:hypothetical protein
MRFPRTLTRYLARETLQYSAVGFLGIATLLLANSLLRQLEDLIGIGGGVADVAAVTIRLIAVLTTYALPIALLFGTLAALGRLGSDHEVIALRSLGISLAQLATPALALAVLASVATGWLLQRGEVGARRSILTRVGEVPRGGVICPGTSSSSTSLAIACLRRPAQRGRPTGRADLGSQRRSAPSVLATSGAFEFDREQRSQHLVLRTATSTSTRSRRAPTARNASASSASTTPST